ncbi:SagB family peptide dehydrogenase [Streptomyces sp. NPDC058989]|uniref:SagB family peptide dehydrogenase n=1 Tax=Streptomyces sp. NPDC058989 TaxID=3346686 RepID=UPI0036ACB01E
MTLEARSALTGYVPHGHVPDRRPLDLREVPARHKVYPGVPRIGLPWESTVGDSPLSVLGAFLRNLCGLTRMVWMPGVDLQGNRISGTVKAHLGRPAPSGGGLHPMEAYLAVGGPAMEPALLHYDPAHHALEQLRRGDHREALTGLLHAPPPTPPALVLVLTSRFWRNAVKYREFGYRLQTQEAGVLAAQAVAVADRLGVPTEVHLNFADRRVNALLGLTPSAEAAMVVITLHGAASGGPAAGSGPGYDGLVQQAVPEPLFDVPPIRDRLPATAALHEASLTTGPGTSPGPPRHPHPLGEPITLPRLPVRSADGIDLRRSPPDGFLPDGIGDAPLAGVLEAAAAGLPGAACATAMYCLALRVDGIPAGAYRYDPVEHALRDIRSAPRDLAPVLSHTPVGEAAAVLLPVGDPVGGLVPFGARWYRLLQADVGIALQRGALAAAAVGLAARIHSGEAPELTAGLGLDGTQAVLSALLIGVPRAASTWDHPIAAHGARAQGRSEPGRAQGAAHGRRSGGPWGHTPNA